MRKKSGRVSEAVLAKKYDDTRDLSDFDERVAEPVHVRRNVTISVRFSEDEMAMLRAKADESGEPVTAYIRLAALQQVAPVDRARLLKALRAASDEVGQAAQILAGQ
jgi:hypothetical protein